MRYSKTFAFAFLALILLALTGCGSSGSTTTDPMASNTTSTNTNSTTDPIFSNVSTANGKTGITLTTDRASVDVINGQVLVTAQVLNNSMPVPGIPVTFSVVAPINGPATIEAGLTTVTTDSNGMAITRVTAGDANSTTTTNVIVQGAVTIGAQSAIAQTTFQIIRGGGVIMFSSQAGITPGGQTNVLAPISAEGVDPLSWYGWVQLIPFKVTDSDGNPRVSVPVTLSVYNINGITPSLINPQNPDVLIDFSPLPSSVTSQTVTTDSAGQGLFNIFVSLRSYDAGQKDSVSIIFKAVTNDSLPVTAYVGNTYSVTSKVPTPPTPSALAIAPSTASFGSSTDITFTIAGGTAPYNVSSNKSNRVSATLLADGKTVSAHLLDSTQWTDSVAITVIDAKGQTASATVTR